MDKITIIKASGEKAPFQMEKVRRSLERAGANEITINEIVKNIEDIVFDGMTTKKIYQMAFKMLKRKSRVSASKYKLKKALMELGPSGYPFEKFVGKLLEHEGFQTQVSSIIQGSCVTHEVDVIAQKDKKHYMIECKYHSDQGRFCNVKIPLYIHSRFLDVEKQWEKQQGHKTKFHQGGVYTNTRFTTDAIQYGTCVGLMLTSWDYPEGNGLKERIDKSGLHPLTSLTTLTKAEKSKLLDKGIVLCKELHETPTLLNEIGIDKTRHKKILEDSEALCKNH
ncbi:MAG TPA: ATPase [Muricauda sp.]|jgi:Holliday junction resolvase-like predicted endonuclease|uniref:ATPase n=6 Tax=Flagellimonas TaxID=444459 RepID=A0A4S8RZ76_9FLAO|nr:MULTISPECIES: ATP cone domain-containing protein [Allomuricauda]MAO17965.1 ATPase [Allomuricauda sp.]UBZ14447.1 restriction endonuclease [Allomuricauda aquimarina]KAB5483970.1 ATPase [Allomuricauda hadalis]MBC72272.1 ATPase [Allomuricauda sp.]MBO0355845.1 restriction endonuclease [Allomuricauda aurea]|tara:strand:+ start:1195 stop:2034 length:840 start_codon:yes stop_codon:yes gene_type:complete